MYRAHALNVLGLIAGLWLGTLTTTLVAQGPTQDGTNSKPYLITQTGGWNKPLKCAAQNIAFTISVDNAAPVPATGVTWSANTDPVDVATYPYVALFPQSQFPASVRTVGVHRLDFNQPAVTILLADGVTPYTYPAATYTEYVKTLPDTATTIPPKDGGGWKKIIGTIAAFFRSVFRSFV